MRKEEPMDISARRGAWVAGAAIALTVALTAPPASASVPVSERPTATLDVAPLTNLAHLDFLLDQATPPSGVEGHTTYRLAEEPTLTMPWTYADARPGGAFERVGGGGLDPATGYWRQGAYNADDIARAAVVYLRHWQLTGEDSSRDKAYELLRSIAYLQTTEGPDAGNVVLWMQADGTLTPPRSLPSFPIRPIPARATGWRARSGRSARATRRSRMSRRTSPPSSKTGWAWPSRRSIVRCSRSTDSGRRRTACACRHGSSSMERMPRPRLLSDSPRASRPSLPMRLRPMPSASSPRASPRCRRAM